MKKLLLFLLSTSILAHGQAFRWSVTAQTVNSSAPQPGALLPALNIPNATIAVCTYPANGVPCTNYATTYTDPSGTTTCPSAAQLTGNNSAICIAKSDVQGNAGAWLKAGNFQYTMTTLYGSFGPYDVTVGGGGGSGSGTVSGQTSGKIPLATAATVIGAPSHLDDGVTTPSTITSTETLVAPSVSTPALTVTACTTGQVPFGDGTGACITPGSGSVSGQTVNGKIPLATGPTVIGAQSALDDGVTTPSTVTSTEAIAAPSLNGVYDLKAAFGASGSNQTVTCSATSGSSILTGCTTADFRAGQPVFIPSSGITPTISTPSSITATCGSDNGGSCTGSTVYGYEIVAVQGLPNGTMTAASAAVTVTQANQSKRAAVNSAWPDVYTTLAIGSSATNVSMWLVYKSINGGTYNFYTAVIYAGVNTTWKDFGDMSANLFTCADLGVPCTAPASATPNDVYAKIASISGSTITLASNTGQPAYRTGLGLSGSYPSQPSVTGTVTVQHDDTPAFQNAVTALRALSSGGQLQLHIPAGNYMTHPEATDQYLGVIRASGLQNVTFQGDGDSTYIYESNDRSLRYATFMRSECGDAAGFGCRTYRVGQNVGSGTAYTLNDPVNVGSTSVTLTTPAQASNFPAGTYVTVYNNATPYPYSDYGEINLVTSADTSTGILTLRYPTDKMYSATLNVAPFSQCSSCQATPSITPMTGGLSASHLSFRNFRVYGHSGLFLYNAVDSLSIDNITATTAYFSESGVSRNVKVTNNSITEDGYSVSSGLIVGAQADADFTVTGNTYRNLHSFGGGQNCTEGAANFLASGNTMEYSGHLSSPVDSGAQQVNGGSLVTWGSGCFNFQFKNNHIRLNNSGIYSVLQALDANGSATISENDIYVDSVSSSNAASASLNSLNLPASPYYRIYGNSWTVGNGNGNNGGTQVSGNSLTWAGLTTFQMPVTSGGISIYPYLGTATVFRIPMSGNVTSINLGSVRFSGLYFAIDFVQPASGGPYTLPSTCANAGWATGSGIDCPNSYIPLARTAASSHSLFWFYDDGTTVHLVGGNQFTGTGSSGGGGTSWYNGLVENVSPSTSVGVMGYMTNCGSSTQLQALTPVGSQSTSAALANSCAGFYAGAGAPIYKAGNQPHVQTAIGYSAAGDFNANARIWLGLFVSSCAIATFTGSDTPACSYAAFRYSTVAGDTIYQFCTDTGSGTPNCQAVGSVAPATAYTFFDINFSPSNATVTGCISATAPASGGTCVTSSTKVPTTSTAFYDVWTNTTQAAAATHIRVGPIYGVAQNGVL